MDRNELFIGNDLPEVLNKTEFVFYFNKYKAGDNSARNVIILHNIKLVLKIVLSRYNLTGYEYNDLVSIGLIGLIKAVDTYDLNKKISFSTYATKCINNEILHFMKMDRKNFKCVSFNTNNNDNNLCIENFLGIKDANINDLETAESIVELDSIVDNLKDKEKQVIRLYFGFADGNRHTQKEIASILNISVNYTNMLIKKALKEIKTDFERKEKPKVKAKR